jgi:hypothetical protein
MTDQQPRIASLGIRPANGQLPNLGKSSGLLNLRRAGESLVVRSAPCARAASTEGAWRDATDSRA